jgi:hypothetical protein
MNAEKTKVGRLLIKMENKKLNDVVDALNVLFCAFFGIGFIYSESRLFQLLGCLFLLWSCFYAVYNNYRGVNNG